MVPLDELFEDHVADLGITTVDAKSVHGMKSRLENRQDDTNADNALLERPTLRQEVRDHAQGALAKLRLCISFIFWLNK